MTIRNDQEHALGALSRLVRERHGQTLKNKRYLGEIVCVAGGRKRSGCASPEERATPVAVDTGPQPANSWSAAADMEIQLPATDKRAVGKVEDSEMEDGHNES